jgi:xanthine dehydrogenase accessory factor
LIYSSLVELIRKKRKVALATLVESEGSTPQVPGASAVFSSRGLVRGTLGGGIIEAEAQKKAREALLKKASGLYEFRLTADVTSEEGAVCGGRGRILIDARPEAHRQAFMALRASLLLRQPGLLLTLIRRNRRKAISLTRFWLRESFIREDARACGFRIYEKDLMSTLLEKHPVFKPLKVKQKTGQAGDAFLYIEPQFPLPQLVIAGAGHIGQAVAHLGHLLDFEVTVIDDRAEYASRRRFPGADRIIVEDIGKAVREFSVGPDTYIVIVTRGHSRDADALRACIHREAAYIGMIGSRQKVRLMRRMFLRKDWASPAQFDRVHAPIGIPIGSKTVEEIAVSIAAELVSIRSGKQEK